MYYIPQITTNDCLFTTFKILLANIKNDERYLYLPEDEKRGPYSLFEIIEKGKTFGVELLGFEADDKKQLKGFEDLPLILNIKRGNDGLHSVYVYKVSKRFVYFLDSDMGKIKMAFDKFISLWNGTGLMVKSNNMDASKPEIVSIKAKRSFLGRILQVLSGVFFIIGIYFIDDQINVLVPVICLLIGLILEILTKVIQLKDMKKFDFDTIYLLEKMKVKNYSEFLPRREKLKLNLFSAKNNYLFYLMSCFFVIFIILFNNPMHVACVFAPILLAVIQSLIISPLEKKKNLEIEVLEVKFSREKNGNSAANALRHIEDESFKFSYSVFGKKMIGILVFLLAGFITLILLDALNLINLFFLLFTEMFLYESLIPIFSFESRIIEEKLNYMRFINLVQ